MRDISSAERITQEIRSAIQSGLLKPGERLVERSLAAQYGVSHIPVREALAKLGNERLVERIPHRGARVAVLEPIDLVEISSLRIVLEQFVSERVQARWSADSEFRLTQVVEQMIEAAGVGDTEEMFRLDKHFHRTLWELSEHKLLMLTNAQLRARIDRFLRSAIDLLEPEQRIEHARSHQQIVTALASGDPGLARVTVATHIETAVARIHHGQSAVLDEEKARSRKSHGSGV